MYRILLLSLCITCFVTSGYAQPYRTYFNPGIKIGKVIGADAGMVIGVELSYSWLMPRDPVAFGAVLGADYFTQGGWKLRAGVEAWSYIGLEVGPSIYFDDGTARTGLSLTAYALGVVSPFYSYSMVRGARSREEFGLFLKYPWLIHPGESSLIVE